MEKRRESSPLLWVVGLIFVIGLGWLGISELLRERDPNALWGTVLLDGEPIAKGQLMLIPDETAGNVGGKAFAEIRDGYYSTLPSQPVTPGASIALVTVYPTNEANGNKLTLTQLAQIQSYQTNLEVPSGGATDFVVNVSSE